MVRGIFGFGGRAGRKRFWIQAVLSLVALLVLMLVFWVYSLSIPGAYENGGPTPFPADPIGIAGAVIYFALLGLLLVTMAALGVRRLHDRDKSGWWILLFAVAPNLLSGAGQYLVQNGIVTNAVLTAPLMLGAIALLAWGLIELGFLPGTRGGNRFGPDPVDRSQGAA